MMWSGSNDSRTGKKPSHAFSMLMLFFKKLPPFISTHTSHSSYHSVCAESVLHFCFAFFFCFSFGINYLNTLGTRRLSRSQNKLWEWYWQSYLWGRLPFVIPAPRTATINKQTFNRAAKWQLTQEREWQSFARQVERAEESVEYERAQSKGVARLMGSVEGGGGQCTVLQCTCVTRLNAFQLVGIPHRATPCATHASHPPYDAWVACVTAAICFKAHTYKALLTRRRRGRARTQRPNVDPRGGGANSKTQTWAIYPMNSCSWGMQNKSKTHTYRCTL